MTLRQKLAVLAFATFCVCWLVASALVLAVYG